jgi:hypothetical protein
MTTPNPVPYAIDTKCKGWRFELDIERIQQSDTWALAALDVRPWLLMVWTTAWSQTPCGSLPSEEEILIARLGITKKFFEKNKSILLRGWWLADDGRLYHDTIAESVLLMLGKRTSEAQRKADYRKMKDTERRDEESRMLGQMSHGTDVGQTPVSHGSATPVPVPVPVPVDKEIAPRKRSAPPASIEKPEDVDSQTWSDWLQLRKSKSAPVTATVLKGARAESVKAGMSLEDFLQTWCRRGSQGLDASWLVSSTASPMKGDVIHTTVPSSNEPDQALEKIKRDAELAVPMPAHVRQKIQQITTGRAH